MPFPHAVTVVFECIKIGLLGLILVATLWSSCTNLAAISVDAAAAEQMKRQQQRR